MLITVMSEGELHVPRLGRVAAAPGFRLVAAMNPFDAVGTARIASAVYDRCCRLAMGYQDADEEREIVDRHAPDAAAALGPTGLLAAVAVVRDSREHADVRTGSSVRGAIRPGARGRRTGRPARRPGGQEASVTLDAACWRCRVALRVREGCGRTAEEIVTEALGTTLPCSGRPGGRSGRP